MACQYNLILSLTPKWVYLEFLRAQSRKTKAVSDLKLKQMHVKFNKFINRNNSCIEGIKYKRHQTQEKVLSNRWVTTLVQRSWQKLE